MRTRNLLTVSVLGFALALSGFAASASAATVEGKISSVAADQHTLMVNKKTYHVSDTAKVLIAGKPAAFGALKSGMTCKLTLAHTEAQALACNK